MNASVLGRNRKTNQSPSSMEKCSSNLQSANNQFHYQYRSVNEEKNCNQLHRFDASQQVDYANNMDPFYFNNINARKEQQHLHHHHQHHQSQLTLKQLLNEPNKMFDNRHYNHSEHVYHENHFPPSHHLNQLDSNNQYPIDSCPNMYSSWTSGSGLMVNSQDLFNSNKISSPIAVVPSENLESSYKIFEGSPYDDFIYRKYDHKKFKFNSLHSSPVSRRSPICAIHKHPSFHSIETNI